MIIPPFFSKQPPSSSQLHPQPFMLMQKQTLPPSTSVSISTTVVSITISPSSVTTFTSICSSTKSSYVNDNSTRRSIDSSQIDDTRSHNCCCVLLFLHHWHSLPSCKSQHHCHLVHCCLSHHTILQAAMMNGSHIIYKSNGESTSNDSSHVDNTEATTTHSAAATATARLIIMNLCRPHP
jgi:hypothetical protein